MIKAIALALGLLLLPVVSYAETFGVKWRYSPEQEAAIIGYKIHNNADGVVVLDNIDPSARRTDLELSECTDVYIMAYNQYKHSVPSDVVTLCPTPDVDTPGGFQREIQYTSFKLSITGTLSSNNEPMNNGGD